jgi:hypothetical protein
MKYKDIGEFNRIDFNDYLIIKYLEKVGPREGLLRAVKLMQEDKTLKLNYGRSYYRVKKLIQQKIINFDAKIDPFRIGLEGIIVFFEVNPKHANIFEKAISLNKTLVYYARFYGSVNGYITQFTVPFGYRQKFREFLDALVILGLAKNYKMYDVGNYVKTEFNLDWYDFQNNKPVYKWQELIHEIKNTNVKIEDERIIVKDFYDPDEVDLKILKEIDDNPVISLTDISKKIVISIPLVKYHYDKHLIQNGIIKSFLIKVVLFKKKELISLHYAIIDFTTKENREKFIHAIKNKHFVWQATSIANSNSLALTIHIPYYEYMNFNRFLWDLVKEGLVENFLFGTIDIDHIQSKIIPYELFVDGKWIYPHNEIIKSLQELVITESLKSQ